MRNKTGISLIVLVITIIVMIILAGTIIISLNNNGIIGKSEEAVAQTNVKALEHDVTKTLVVKGWYEGKEITEEEFKSYLDQVPEVTSVIKVAGGTWKVERESAIITVYQTGEIIQGEIDIWDGETSSAPQIKEGNWYIYTGAELRFLTEFVNNANQLTDAQKTLVSNAGYNESDYVISETTTIYLMKDLDLGARHSKGILTSGKEWIPIGDDTNRLIGTFEGNSHYITGMYIQGTENSVGLIGATNGQIKKLTIKNSYVSSTASYLGGIAGKAQEIYDCHNINTEVTQIGSESKCVGGIAGAIRTSGKLISCTNSGKVTNEGTHIGGVVGAINNSGKVSNCNNSGNVTGTGGYVGGIVGYIGEAVKADNCVNKGNIRGTGGYVGGIAGIMINSSDIKGEISYCINVGDIGGFGAIGGIVGSIESFNLVTYCKNTGNISGSANCIGGIIGLGTTDYTENTEKGVNVSYCYNTGKVVGEMEYVGGIAGALVQFGSLIERCYNVGTIEGKGGLERLRGIGGIVGGLRDSTIQNCYNIANINGPKSIGGILGEIYVYEGDVGNCNIISSYNLGTITGDANIGGIIGANTNGSTITNSYYLQGTASLDEGTGTTSTLMKDSIFIKETFLTTANAIENIWEIRPDENNEYPVLIGLK